jgi:hypothetical protein
MSSSALPCRRKSKETALANDQPQRPPRRSPSANLHRPRLRAGDHLNADRLPSATQPSLSRAYFRTSAHGRHRPPPQSHARQGRLRPAPHRRPPAEDPRLRLPRAARDTPIDTKTMESFLKEICPEKRWTEFLEKRISTSPTKSPGSPASAATTSTTTGARPPSSARSRENPLLRRTQAPRGAEETLPPQRGPRRRHRPHRLRQVHDARGDDRLHQHEPLQTHHHHRGPDRVRAPG